MKKFILSLLVLFGIGVLTACQPQTENPKEDAKVTAVEITNTVTNFYVGDTVQIETKLTTSGDDADKTLSYETSCDKLATVSSSGLVSFLDDGTVTISVYSKSDIKVSDSITFVVTEKGPTLIEINNTISSGRVGDEFELDYTVSPSEYTEEVEVTVSDDSILELDGTTVKLIGVGTATITVSSKVNAEIKDTLTVEVLKAAPTSITINNTETMGYVGGTLTLDYTVNPSNADANVEITVDDSEVLTIDGTTLKLVGAGTAEVTVKSTVDSTVLATLSVEVIKPDFLLNQTGYAANVDYSHMSDAEEPYLITNSIFDGDNPHAFAMFNVSGTRYYAEATVSMLNATGDGWARFGIGSATEDSDGHARAFFFSPKEGQKIVMMDVPNGWGAVTAQSMIWQANGINQLDPTNIKLAILRDGNCYYYLINDKLYWYEENANFNGVATYPTIVTKDTQIRISDWSFSDETSVVDSKLALPAMNQVFFNADPEGRVNYVSDSEFSITGQFFQNTCVKSIGDKALLKGNFVVEFDLSNVVIDAQNDNNTRIGIALRHVGVESPYKADTFAMANNGAQAFDYRVFTWGGGDHTYWQGQDAAIRANGDSIEGHYKLVRTIENGASTLQLFFEGEKVLEVTTSYVGDYHAMFGANLASGTFKNVVLNNLD